MFEIKDCYKIKVNVFKIVSDYQLLDFNDFPILFCGRNRKYQIVIASIICEQDGVFRYFYAIPVKGVINRFIKMELDLQNVYFSVDDIWVVDQDVNGNILNAWKVPIHVLPAEYFIKDNYCPKQESD